MHLSSPRELSTSVALFSGSFPKAPATMNSLDTYRNKIAEIDLAEGSVSSQSISRINETLDLFSRAIGGQRTEIDRIEETAEHIARYVKQIEDANRLAVHPRTQIGATRARTEFWRQATRESLVIAIAAWLLIAAPAFSLATMGAAVLAFAFFVANGNVLYSIFAVCASCLFLALAVVARDQKRRLGLYSNVFLLEGVEGDWTIANHLRMFRSGSR